jgi:hypothetical protein
MDHIINLFGAAAAIAIHAPRALSLKLAALALAALLLPTAYGSMVDLLGRPKPVAMAWAEERVGEATVLAASLREGEAIYLWLQLDGAPAPRAYVRPWSTPAPPPKRPPGG